MPIDLYHVPESSPCRAVRLVAAALNVDLNLKYVNLLTGEHLKPEFVKMNPQRKVPVLDDNGFYLSESVAICQYLADKYGKDDSLYPKDTNKRAIVNQLLFFNQGVLYQSLLDCYILPIWQKTPAASNTNVHRALQILEEFLEKNNYVAGNSLTIADIVLQCSVSNIVLFDIDLSPYKNVNKWMEQVKSQVPKYDEINEDNLKKYGILLNKVKSTA